MSVVNAMQEIVKIVRTRCGEQNAKECKRLLNSLGLPKYRKITFDESVREHSYVLVWEQMAVEFFFTAE